MITTWQMYWLTRLTDIQGFFQALCFFGVFVTGASLFVCVMAYVETSNFNKKWFYLPLVMGVVSLISGVVACLIPTSQEMAAILIVPSLSKSVAANKEIQQLPGNLVSLANDWIKELEPKKGKK